MKHFYIFNNFLLIFVLENFLTNIEMTSMGVNNGHFGFYGNFYEYKQRKLQIQPLHSLTVKKSDACVLECMSTATCLSLNVFPVSDAFTCELFNTTWYTNNCAFRWNQDGSHHTIYNRCITNVCPPDKRCVPNLSNDSFGCVPKEGLDMTGFYGCPMGLNQFHLINYQGAECYACHQGRFFLVQASSNSNPDLNLKWQDYKNGFRNGYANFIGNEMIHQMTKTPRTLRFWYKLVDGRDETAKFSRFSIASEQENYRMLIGEPISVWGSLITDMNNPDDNILLKLNGTTFSTYDHGTHQDLAREHNMGGWFSDEICILLFPGSPLAPTAMYQKTHGNVRQHWLQISADKA